jgi:hypothetical protein
METDVGAGFGEKSKSSRSWRRYVDAQVVKGCQNDVDHGRCINYYVSAFFGGKARFAIREVYFRETEREASLP